ncbi:MAG: MFS transporter [Nakamurella sp.]
MSFHTGDYRLAFGVLRVPGVLVLVVLWWLRRRVPDPAAYEIAEPPTEATAVAGAAGFEPEPVGHQSRSRPVLPPLLWQYVTVVAVLSCGIASFPLVAFHAQTQGLLTEAQIPVLFALAMLTDGLSGLAMGHLYDKRGPTVLLAVPVAAAIAAIAFTHQALLIWIGVGVWGVVNGVLDSTIKAVVTQLVSSDSRARRLRLARTGPRCRPARRRWPPGPYLRPQRHPGHLPDPRSQRHRPGWIVLRAPPPFPTPAVRAGSIRYPGFVCWGRPPV